MSAVSGAAGGLLSGVADSEVDKWRTEQQAAIVSGLPERLKDLLTSPEPSREALQELWGRVLEVDPAQARQVVSKGLLLAETDSNLRTAQRLVIPTSSRLQALYAAAGEGRRLASDLNQLQHAHVASASAWEQKPIGTTLDVLVPGPYLSEAAILEYMRAVLNVPLRLTFTPLTFSAISRSLTTNSGYDLVVCSQNNVSEVSDAFALFALATSLGYSLVAPTQAPEGVVAIRRHDPRSAGSAAIMALQHEHPLVQNLRLVETPAEQSYEALQHGQHLMAWGALRHAYLLDGSGQMVRSSTQRARVVLLTRRNLPNRKEVLPRLRAWYARAVEELADPRAAKFARDSLLRNPQFERAFAYHIGQQFWSFAA